MGLDAADAMILFRSAVKQIARRNGYLASFMCRPALPNVMSSGWHLHQSLIDRKTKRNAFAHKDGLSPLGMHYLAGLLAHAQGAAAFTTPTVNGYKRYRAYSLAPDRASWARDNRGVMMRVLGQPGDAATHLENRVGEPAANPYLYMASQIYAGLDGIAYESDPGPSADTPYEAEAPSLPKDLAKRLRHCAPTKFSAPVSATPSSTIMPISRRPSSRVSRRRSRRRRPTSRPGNNANIWICSDRSFRGAGESPRTRNPEPDSIITSGFRIAAARRPE